MSSGKKAIEEEELTGDLNDALLAFERKKFEEALSRFDSARDLAEYLDISQTTNLGVVGISSPSAD